MLGNPDPVDRFAAAEALAALGEAARPHFLDLNVEAARAAVAALAAMLGNPDPVERFAAAEALAALGEAARPHFLDLNAQAARPPSPPWPPCSATRTPSSTSPRPRPWPRWARRPGATSGASMPRPPAPPSPPWPPCSATRTPSSTSPRPRPWPRWAKAARPHFLDLNAQAARAAVAALVEMLSAERADQGRPRAEVASQALRGLGINPIEYAEQIVTAFSTGRVDDLALLNLAGPIKNLDVIAALLEQIYHADPSIGARFRFSLHYLGGGWEPMEILLAWLGEPQDLPGETSERTMRVFRGVWATISEDKKLEKLRQDLARKCAIVARRTEHWTGTGRALLEEMASELDKKGLTEADTLRAVMASLQVRKWYSRIFGALAIHIACWAMLIFAYPRFRLVQAIFFWNPWVRRFTGLAYVGFLLAWVPWLRARLFEPFRDSMLADAHL